MLKFKEFIALDELDEARLIKVNRVRAGKVQRRHIVSATTGYKIINGKLVRMSSMEKRHRRIAQIVGARKRRSKVSVMLRRRKISLRKRTSSGLK